MAEFGISDAGFVLKRLSDILTEMTNALSQVQDPHTGEYLTPELLDENDPLIQILNSFADSLSSAWEQLQLVYNQFDPLKATGAGLSGLVQLNGIRRRAGQPTTVELLLTGTAGTTIPVGRKVTDMKDTTIFELPATEIGIDGTVTVTGTATVDGPFEALVGTLVKINTPVNGWDSVTNLIDAVPGTYEETDSQLRQRQQWSTVTGSATIESIYAVIMNIENVTHARIYQNNTLEDDDRGIPAKCIAPVVIGGDDDEIANAIYTHLATGCATFGNTSVNIQGLFDMLVPIWFTRPTEIPIWIEIDIVPYTDSWSEVNVDIIIANVLAYCQGGAGSLGVEQGWDRDGYIPGETVFASELYTPVNKITGIQITAIRVGLDTDSSDSSSPIYEDSVVIAWNEIAVFDSERISVSVIL